MLGFLRVIFNTSAYSSPVQKDRARMIYAITLILMVLYALYMFFVVNISSGTTLWQEASLDTQAALLIMTFYGIGLVTLLATSYGWELLSGFGPVLMWLVGGVLIAINNEFLYATNSLTLVTLILVSSLLNRERGLVIGFATSLAALSAGIALRASSFGGPSAAVNTSDFLTLALELLAVSAFIYLFLRLTQISRLEAIGQAATARLRLAEITTEIAQRISSRLALSEVLNNAVEQICQRYPDIYHAQIFLVDDIGEEARLAASTGDVGQLLLKRKHSLPVGSASVIGQVTSNGELVIARADSPGSVHRPNQYLPDTQVEAAFPLRIGGSIIGSLDLQSKVLTAFQETEIPIFQALADSIAIAIDNARLFEQTEQRIRENQRLVEQSREALREVERLNRQLTKSAWEEYLKTKTEGLGVSIDFDDNTTTPIAQEWTASLVQAIRYNHVIQEQQKGGQVIAVPLRVRGQVVGAMEFELGGEQSFSPEDLDLVQEVGERFGLAVENTRLYEESQRIAQREALVNSISSRLQTSNSVETIMAEAARGLQQTLKLSKVAIRLGSPAAPDGAPGGG